MPKSRVSLAIVLAACFVVAVTAQQGGNTAQQGGNTQRSGGAQQGTQPRGPAQEQPSQQGDQGQQPQQPTFRGAITFVRVDVIVPDKKAQPISDLKQTDFEVFEDGKPQTIEQFTAI